MKHWMTVSLALALAGAAGCGNDGVVGGGGDDNKIDLGDDKVARTGEKLSDYAGSWHGYTEAFQFQDGTDTIAIELDEQGNGVIEVGEADPLPPPNPDEVYPPIGEALNDPFAAVVYIGQLNPGFSYPISGARVESKRIQFQSSPSEIIREWCELQTSVSTDDGRGGEWWRCLPNNGFQTTPDGCFLGTEDHSMPVACGKLACVDNCTCTEAGCEPMPNGLVQFDAALQSDGEELVGTLALGDHITVRLMRE